MSQSSGVKAAGRHAARASLALRLHARRSEIEQAVFARVCAVSDSAEAPDPEYVEGLRRAVSAAVDYGLAGVELGEERSPPPPPALPVQARMAARSGVGLDTVLRRYCAGQALFGDFLIEEAERSGLQGAALQRLLRAQAALFDRLLATVSDAHAGEAQRRLASSEHRRAERIQRLLAGELLDTSELSYDFGAHHLGAIAQGLGAAEAIRELATSLDRRLLRVTRDEATVWAWFGGLHPVDPAELARFVSTTWPTQLDLAIGEPARGLGGWRLTHQQARAAMPIVRRCSQSFVRYADVSLLASMFQDQILATSLRELYLVPLERERGGGKVARETLRAYFAAERNISATATAMGLNRNTVASRLRMIEETIGRPLSTCATEIEAALRLAELSAASVPPQTLALR